ncbi:scavenger receptor cysteine-rich type 1 protein M130-like isoform X2 [Perca fluviatilis]|uniref:scavenger receptor cysteine-rich type 1 protein M130-like isoform X2 n=1 Tax=Perca fluviatilis TaxID=8168 RepID=UPI001964CE26|nr:scavenger receptor cysteine-rich type 1 protein M130-like isoform X2 [Perca fluviatilis]
MARVLVLFMLLWSSGFPGFQTKKKDIDDIRLLGGSSRCSGVLQVKRQGVWKEVDDNYWDLKLADVVCRHLDCGSVIQALSKIHSYSDPYSSITPSCLESRSRLKKCLTKRSMLQATSLEIICSDSVRLVNGTSLCSGRLEVKSNQSTQSWSSVCEDDFDLQDAEVVCRELHCGSPSVLQGALYGDMEDPVWTKEFQCRGHESALLDCDSSDRNTCSSGKAVGLTCSEPDHFQLVRGSSRCAGELEMKIEGEWLVVDVDDHSAWNLKAADVVCRHLDCGSAVSTGWKKMNYYAVIWMIRSTCLQSKSAVRECILTKYSLSLSNLEIICSDSIRLVNGTSLCSGRLEVKSTQSTQLWSSVCEDDFDLQDAKVVCSELGCGAPSVLQGALYGDMEAPVGTKEFQCRGHESYLLDCDSSDRNTCSSGKAAGLTCSEPGVVRLVGGASRCDGTLEMKHQNTWKPVDDRSQNLRLAGMVCGELGCGFAFSTRRQKQIRRESWGITLDCNTSSLLKCFTEFTYSTTTIEITCSDSQTVRLVNGTSLCSGRLEIKSTQSWSSVCEDDFDLQDAEVVCRELECGAPSVLQGALYGDMEAPVWTKQFQCRGHESSLLDCDSSASNTCPSGKAAGLTCSGPDYIRLVGEPSRCAGKPEMKNYGEWRRVVALDFKWNRMSADAVCRKLDCGSAVPMSFYYIGGYSGSSAYPVWLINSSCVQSKSAVKECVTTDNTYSSIILEITCSDLLAQPKISPSPSPDAVYKAKQQRLQVLMGSNFTIRCSVRPQYPGGSFKLIVPTPDPAQNYTLPAVNHSAHFQFSAADSTHRGEYRCVYHLYVFSDNFSSESRPLHLTLADLLAQPNISFSTHIDGVSEATQQGLRVLMDSDFTISCSVLPQYPGGSFQLIFNTSDPEQKTYTLPAVNHSAHFLFSAADSTHRGEYRCVYHLNVFSHDFSSESGPLHLTLAGQQRADAKTRGQHGGALPLWC